MSPIGNEPGVDASVDVDVAVEAGVDRGADVVATADADAGAVLSAGCHRRAPPTRHAQVCSLSRNIGCFTRDIHDFLKCCSSATIGKP